MPRLLIWGDAGAATGFGEVVTNIGERLTRDHGWETSVLAVNFRGDVGSKVMDLYVPTLLEKYDVYGMSRIVELLGRIGPDAILFVNDPHVLLDALFDNRWDPNFVLLRGVKAGETTYRPPIVAYLPIDGYDSPKSWDMSAMRVKRVAMTEFGQRAMPEAPIIWHGIDPVFRPIPKREAKKALGYDPARFLIVRVDKNSARKDYPATWKAVRPLLRKYADIDMHWHTQPNSPDGFDLRGVMFNDTDVRDRVNYSANLGGFTGWPSEQVALLQAAGDVFVSTSHGEGWGLTIGQSLACGTPVVATDCSAITEVVGPGGILVPPAGRASCPIGQDQCLPDVPAFTATIEKLYLNRGLRRRLAAAGLDHIKRANWDTAATQINDILRAAVAGEDPDAIPRGIRPPGDDPVEVREVREGVSSGLQ